MKKILLMFILTLFLLTIFPNEAAFLSTKDGKIYDDYYVTTGQMYGDYYNNLMNMLNENPGYDIFFRQSEDKYYTLRSLIDFKIIEKYLNDKQIFIDYNIINRNADNIYYQYMNNPGYKQYILQIFENEQNFRSFAETISYKEVLIEELRKVFSNHTDEEIQNYLDNNREYLMKEFQSVNASHILVESKEKALEIKKAIENNEISFSDAAKEYSSCPSKDRGGNLGSFGKGQMVKEFEDAAFNTEPGVITDPVFTQFGYHLILVNNRTDFSSIDDIKNNPELMQTVNNILTGSKIEQWFTRYRENFDFIINYRPLQIEYEAKRITSFEKYEILEEYYRQVIKTEDDIPEKWLISYLDVSDFIYYRLELSMTDLNKLHNVTHEKKLFQELFASNERIDNKISELENSLNNPEIDKEKVEKDIQDLKTMKNYKNMLELNKYEDFLSIYNNTKNKILDIKNLQKNILIDLSILHPDELNIHFELIERFPDDLRLMIDFQKARFVAIENYILDTGRKEDAKDLLIHIIEELEDIKLNDEIEDELFETINDLIENIQQYL